MLSKAQKVLLALVLIVAITGVLLAQQNNQPAVTNGTVDHGNGSQEPAETAVELTLYFSDDQAMYLLPEQRNVTIGEGESIEETVVRELIKGPSGAGLKRTIPPETSLLSLSIENGVAGVNFSKDIQDSRYGDSAGESMLVYSIVNSLTELPGINQVQILVEGKKIESLYGHIGAAEPLEPNPGLVQGNDQNL
jgi:germination protein M